MPTSTVNLASVAPVSRVSQQAAPTSSQVTPLTDISMSGINPIGVNASIAYGNTGGQGSNLVRAAGTNLADQIVAQQLNDPQGGNAGGYGSALVQLGSGNTRQAGDLAAGNYLNTQGAQGYGGAIVSAAQGDYNTAGKQAATNYAVNELGSSYAPYVSAATPLFTNGVNQQTVNASANTAFWTYLGTAVGTYFGEPTVGGVVGGAIGGLTTDMGIFNFSFAKGGKVPNQNIAQAHLQQLQADLQQLSALADRLPNGAEIAQFIQQHFVPVLEQKKAQGDVPGMIRVLLMMRAFLQQNIQNARSGAAGGALGAMAQRPAAPPMGAAMPPRPMPPAAMAPPPAAMPRPMAAPVARPAPMMAPRPAPVAGPAPSPLAQMQGGMR